MDAKKTDALSSLGGVSTTITTTTTASGSNTKSITTSSTTTSTTSSTTTSTTSTTPSTTTTKPGWTLVAASTPPYNIVVFGTSGVGKSATLNTLFGLPLFKSGGGPFAVTEEIVARRRKFDNVVLAFHDSPGLGNNRVLDEKDKETLKNFEGLCKDKKIHLLIIVASCIQRFTGIFVDSLKEFGSRHPELRSKAIVVITNAMAALPDEEVKENQSEKENWIRIRNERKEGVSRHISEILGVKEKTPTYFIENHSRVAAELKRNDKGEPLLPDGTAYRSEIFKAMETIMGITIKDAPKIQ